ncbi:succinate semialdehyde dehydrogenase [Desarmillaria tabescens]|uniref:Succinate semialdehyde dehydrogenase n=1 Tax=Armillaria tabescens TaxID=1929756 RepID=A0AA39JPI2_ARMTA|nr:succinate semialdehyde dehydrogenase [Desarmillaria tabescens]KAK0446082.1 succinate semialdehyde dehydrogenase [Desarmillaria tabescens]
MSVQTTIIPHSQQRSLRLDGFITSASKAQKAWSKVPLKERIATGYNFIVLCLIHLVTRPVIRGFLDRANYMLSIAESALADVSLTDTDKPGFRRYSKRAPLGVVLVVATLESTYPYLVSINAVLPAIIAGNAVILKPSPQTPLTAERFALALTRAGTLFSFTGSVIGGRAVEEAAGVGLELGGKDPAYVRPDADLNYTIGELVDCCCAIERIYVHEAGYVKLVKGYKLGDPTLPETNLGPVVSLASAERIRKQVSDAVKADLFPMAKAGTTYVAPQVLVDVNHKSFGPTEAVKLMNDSPYGLTASVWTNASANPASEEIFLKLCDELETGTVFLNRCDFLDPALAWTGVKDSGRGVSLSKFGYDQLTRAKSVHMKIRHHRARIVYR